MKQITQIETKEYNELFKLANANSEEIERRAQKMFEQKGISKLVVRMQVEEDSSAEISLNVNSYVYENEAKYALSNKDKRALMGFTEKKLRRMMEQNYGVQISDISSYKRLLKKESDTFRNLLVFTFSGWLAAIALIIINLLK